MNYLAGNRANETSAERGFGILFSDDYTTNTGWTQVGATLTVDSGTII